MKQFKFLQMLLICLITLGITSCSKDEDDSDKSSTSPIVGIWVHDFSSGYSFNVFNENGSGYYFEFDYKDGYRPGEVEYMDPFTYKYNEEDYTLTIAERENWGIERYSYTIRELTSTQLKIINPDGYLESYTRYNGDLDDIEKEFNVTLKVDND